MKVDSDCHQRWMTLPEVRTSTWDVNIESRERLHSVPGRHHDTHYKNSSWLRWRLTNPRSKGHPIWIPMIVVPYFSQKYEYLSFAATWNTRLPDTLPVGSTYRYHTLDFYDVPFHSYPILTLTEEGWICKDLGAVRTLIERLKEISQ